MIPLWFYLFWSALGGVLLLAIVRATLTSMRRSRWHCARCKKTLRYPACCPHISESGWQMIKNSEFNVPK